MAIISLATDVGEVSSSHLASPVTQWNQRKRFDTCYQREGRKEKPSPQGGFPGAQMPLPVWGALGGGQHRPGSREIGIPVQTNSVTKLVMSQQLQSTRRPMGVILGEPHKDCGC